MSKLIKFELRKLFRSKSLYICAAVAAALGVLTVLIVYFSGEAINDISGMRFLDATAWDLTAQSLSTSLPTLMAIITSLIVCTDHVNGTIKNAISRGYSREKVSLSQIISIVTALIALCVAACAPSIICGGILLELGEPVLSSLMTQLCVLMGYAGLYYLFSALIRKTGGAIAVNIFAVSVIGTLFNLADVLIFYLGRGASIDNVIAGEYLSKYWLSGLLSSAVDTTAGAGEHTAAALIGLMYAAVFCALGFLFSRKRDV